MEEFNIDISDGCYADIINISDYISNIFLDEKLANKVILELYISIKKLSYLAPMFSICDNDKLKKQGVRRYRVKKYFIYYAIDENSKVVTVLRIRHFLQDENKFFK